MAEKKIITICQSGGEFQANEDGSLSYIGGEAHAIDINNQTRLEDFKSEIAEMLKCSSCSVSLKYFLPGYRKTLITISSNKDLQRLISFNEDSSPVDVYIIPHEVVAHDVSNTPASRSSGTTLSEAVVPADNGSSEVVPVDATPIDGTTYDNSIDDPIDMPVDDALVDGAPVDSTPLALPSGSNRAEQNVVSSEWKNAITGVKQRFQNVHEFREALRKYAIANAFAYTCKKNDSRRVTARCKSENCPWRIHASKLSTTQLFCIKRMNPTHTCEGGVMTSRSHATTKWVAGIVKEKLRGPKYYRPKDIAEDIKREYGIELNYYQARQAKEIAREQLQGSYKEAYSQLPIFCERILESNPDSFATFTTKPDSSFHRLFIALHASVHGFQQGCRPLLFLDNAPLNSKYKETLLVATTADGNDGVFPVAFAVVDAETEDNWRWFLMELKSAVSTSRAITFVADIQKGLRESIAEIFENGYHAYCLHYLTENFKKDLPTQFSSIDVKRLLVTDFHAAAHATKLEEFQRSTESIKEVSPEAFIWIVQSKPEHWANAFFVGARYNHMKSNFGQMFYSWVSEANDLPITKIAEQIQCKMMELINERQANSSQWLTRLTPSMEEKLHKETMKSRSLEVLYSSAGADGIFDVRGDSIENVDIDKWICSCKGWQITGLPCCHAIAVFRGIARSPYDYCSRYLTTESYRITYSKSINPVPKVEKPIESGSSQAIVKVTPPPTRRAAGRPKMVNKSKSQRLGKRNFQCSKCKGVGHNRSTCKASV